MPKVSVITPCYNAEAFIEEALESVQRQTLTDWEHVVVDDGSTDRSAEIVSARAEDDDRLRLVRQPNAGTAAARNAGFSQSTGDYLLFLDADDALKPRMLEGLVDYLEARPQVGMAFCKYVEIDAEGERLPDREHLLRRYAPTRFDVCELPPDEPETPPLSIFATSTTVPIPSQSVIRRAVYERTPGFDEDFAQGCEDADLFFHVALRSRVHYVDKELVRYRQHPDQWSVTGQREDPPQRRFARKWKRIDGLTPEQEKKRKRTWRYWRHRIIPRIWWKAGKGVLDSGRYGKGLLLCAAAVARFVVSPLTVGWGWRSIPAPKDARRSRREHRVSTSS
jgi:glycosyltransferase involved in cell wall biosynthesis